MVDGLIIPFARGGFLSVGYAFTFATQLWGRMSEEQMGRKKSHISLRGEASKELFTYFISTCSCEEVFRCRGTLLWTMWRLGGGNSIEKVGVLCVNGGQHTEALTDSGRYCMCCRACAHGALWWWWKDNESRFNQIRRGFKLKILSLY